MRLRTYKRASNTFACFLTQLRQFENKSNHASNACGRFGVLGLTIPLISNEPVKGRQKRLLAHGLAERFHDRPLSILLHGLVVAQSPTLLYELTAHNSTRTTRPTSTRM
jgi:hypothetical protein